MKAFTQSQHATRHERFFCPKNENELRLEDETGGLVRQQLRRPQRPQELRPGTAQAS